MVWGLPALPPYLFSSVGRVQGEFVAHNLVEVIVSGFQTSYRIIQFAAKKQMNSLKT